MKQTIEHKVFWISADNNITEVNKITDLLKLDDFWEVKTVIPGEYSTAVIMERKVLNL